MQKTLHHICTWFVVDRVCSWADRSRRLSIVCVCVCVIMYVHACLGNLLAQQDILPFFAEAYSKLWKLSFMQPVPHPIVVSERRWSLAVHAYHFEANNLANDDDGPLNTKLSNKLSLLNELYVHAMHLRSPLMPGTHARVPNSIQIFGRCVYVCVSCPKLSDHFPTWRAQYMCWYAQHHQATCNYTPNSPAGTKQRRCRCFWLNRAIVPSFGQWFVLVAIPTHKSISWKITIAITQKSPGVKWIINSSRLHRRRDDALRRPKRTEKSTKRVRVCIMCSSHDDARVSMTTH